MSESLFDRIRNFLDEQAVAYRTVSHGPTLTSEASAAARGEDIRIGGKALLIKTGEVFRLFVLSAAAKLDSDAVRRICGVKKVRFATREELLEMTGLVPGSVPPFGPPLLPFELFVDESVAANEQIAFNAGSLTESIIMGTSEYLRVSCPTMSRFSIMPESDDPGAQNSPVT